MHCDKGTVCVIPDSFQKDLFLTLRLQQREYPALPNDVLLQLGVWFLHPSIKRGLDKSQDTQLLVLSGAIGSSPIRENVSVHNMMRLLDLGLQSTTTNTTSQVTGQYTFIMQCLYYDRNEYS